MPATERRETLPTVSIDVGLFALDYSFGNPMQMAEQGATRF